jgi:hypothetical protein
VIGGTLEVAPPDDFVGVEDFVSDSLVDVGVVLAGTGVVVALIVVVLAAGVAWRLTAGGFVVLAVVAGVCAASTRARAAIDAISAGSFCTTLPLPASELAGAGPIAAPTPTPTVSIATASAALARNEGRRVRLLAIGGDAVGASLTRAREGACEASGVASSAGGSEELSMFCEAFATYGCRKGYPDQFPMMQTK